MHRFHSMPFGAEFDAQGCARFRLWAPAARRVDLELLGSPPGPRMPMLEAPGGWYELTTDAASPGSGYRFLIDEELAVPDPASRFQPAGVGGPSELIRAASWEWHDDAWRGRAWEQAVIYELHVGAYTAQGGFPGVAQRLEYLRDLGVTAIELMPIGEFPGSRNWGYDGVLPFAPHHRYGRPESLKQLVEAAHHLGLMVILDVVYNHFGPEGNYLHRYAPDFFTERHHTPWGAAINFDGPGSRTVRDFFIHNALYWIEEYHLDGLRLDAVHAIFDQSEPHILVELANALTQGPGRGRQVVVLENDRNEARYLARDADGSPGCCTAQWNDDYHHALHVLLTGETRGYYSDYAQDPGRLLQRCLSEGFAFQGEPSAYRGGAARGEQSSRLPPTAFVNFAQNHDQIGNRARGERLSGLASGEALQAATLLLLLAPQPPLIFMGQEWATTQPFAFFCDFSGELAGKVREGRRREFRDEFVADGIDLPDALAEATFRAATLDWAALSSSEARRWLALHRELLALRHSQIVPRLAGMRRGAAQTVFRRGAAFGVQWCLADGALLSVFANLCEHAASLEVHPPAHCLAGTPGAAAAASEARLPAWSVIWYLTAP